MNMGRGRNGTPRLSNGSNHCRVRQPINYTDIILSKSIVFSSLIRWHLWPERMAFVTIGTKARVASRRSAQ